MSRHEGIDRRIVALSEFIESTESKLKVGGRLTGDDVKNLRHAIGQVAVLRQTDWNDRDGVAWSDREDALLSGFSFNLPSLLNRAARSVASSNGQPYSGRELFAAMDDPQSVLWKFFQDDAEHAALAPVAPAEAPAPPAPAPAVKPDPVAIAVALKKGHPEWSDRRIAREAGCSPTKLSRDTFYQQVKRAFAADRPPRGSKAAEGGLEAFD